MSEYAKFNELSKDEKTLSVLESIENKVLETGRLATLTGDSHADITLSLEIHEEEPYLLIKITCKEVDVSEDDAEAFQDYVYTKFTDCLAELGGEHEEAFEYLCGACTFVNDEVVY